MKFWKYWQESKEVERPKYAEAVIQARVNGGFYAGDYLASCEIHWPRDTWLSRRRREIKKESL